jgi:putative nucleotidyltransferase with HDIG domain
MSRSAHLTLRFVGSLWPFAPSAKQVAWAESLLQPGEASVWRRMPRTDRRESIAVARRVAAELSAANGASDDVLAAALLHDVGKSEARLGTVGRALATLAGATAGHGMARAWQQQGGVRRRYGLYLRHADVGAGMLQMADARRVAIEWAEHHHHPERWERLSIPYAVAAVLARADGERVPSQEIDEGSAL